MIASPSSVSFTGVCPATLPPPAPHLFHAARSCVWAWRAVSPDRRRWPRVPVIAAALCRPADADGLPAGEPFRAVIVDKSTGGLRLFHDQPVTASRLAVRLASLGPEDVVVEILRSVRHDDYFEYAGPFVSRHEAAGV